MGGRGGGGVGGVSRLRFPPGPHLRSSRFSQHPRLRQAPTRRFAKNRNLRGLGFLWGKGPRPLVGRAPSPGGPGPRPPGDLAHRPPTSPVNFLAIPGLKTLGCHHNPQSADLGGRWMVSEGYSPMRGGGFPSSAFQPLGRASFCIPAHEKPGLLHRLISCAQSLRFRTRAVDRLTTQTSGP